MEGIQINVVRADTNPDISVVRINGYIDTTTSSELERVIQNLLREQRYKIIVDLSGVDYISSAGWGIFISEIKNLRGHRGDLKLANMSANVTEVYELLEFSTILSSAPSIPDAIRLFETPPVPGEGPAAAAKPVLPPRPAAPPTSGSAPRTVPSSAAVVPPAPRPQPAAPGASASRSASSTPTFPTRPSPAPMPTSMPAAASDRPAPVPAPTAAPAPAAPPRDPAKVPLIERIQELVRLHPDWGAWKIKGELNRRRGPSPKVGWGEVRAELKFNGLRAKSDRFRFARGR